MTKSEIEKFAKRIPRESRYQLKVKVGQTNGEPRFHLLNTEAEDRRLASLTIRSENEWLAHPWNKLNRPTKREEALDLEQLTEVTEEAASAFGRLKGAAKEAASSVRRFSESFAQASEDEPTSAEQPQETQPSKE